MKNGETAILLWAWIIFISLVLAFKIIGLVFDINLFRGL
jgi:hypothetical protein